jgi:hypothetical protein
VTALACVGCGEPLAEQLAAVGRHVLCPAPLPPEPPSTLAEIGELLVAYDAARPRSRQRGIGPSEVGIPCDRALLYRIYEVPEVPRGMPWAPIQGTAIDAHVSEVLAWDRAMRGTPWMVHPRVHAGGGVEPSELDIYRPDLGLVDDVKYPGITKIKEARKRGRPLEEYVVQVQVYARGVEVTLGLTPRWVRVTMLPRTHEYGDGWEWTEPYDRAFALDALDRPGRLVEKAAELDLTNHPEGWAEVPATPGDDCRFCKHYRPRLAVADATGCPGDKAALAERGRRQVADLLGE